MYSNGKKKSLNKKDKSYLKVVTDLGRSDVGIYNNIVRLLIIINTIYLVPYYTICIVQGNLLNSRGPLSISLNLELNFGSLFLDFAYALFIFTMFGIFLKYTLYFKLKKSRG